MGLFKIRKLTVAAVILALHTAQQTRGNSAYLKYIGPPPLRFSLATATFGSMALPPSLIERSVGTNSTEIAVTDTNSVATNAAAIQNPAILAPINNLSASTVPNTQNNSTAKPSASDMLVVSPQMLTDYFKPGPDGTNSENALILPVAVGFTPPSAKPSSRATYNSP